MRIFDGHCHVPLETRGVATLLQEMDKLEIERAFVVAAGNISKADLSKQISGATPKSVSIDNLKLRTLCGETGGRLLHY